LRLRHPGLVKAVAFAPDGKTLASVGSNGGIRLWDLASGKEIGHIPGPADGLGSIAFAPDGKSLAGGGHGTVWVWEVGSGRETLCCRGHGGFVGAVAFAGKGRFLASGANWDPLVRLWDVTTGQEVRQFGKLNCGALALAVSRDGQTLAATDHQHGNVCLWDVASGRLLRQLSVPAATVDGVAFAPDGQTVATVAEGNLVHLWDVATGRALRAWGARRFAFSPDGKLLATGGPDATVHLWDPVTGREVRAFRVHGDNPIVLAFAPDGKTLVSSAGSALQLWDVATGQPVRPWEGHQEAVCAVAVAPDGRALATASEDRSVRLWDAATGAPLRDCDTRPDRSGPGGFYPDPIVFAPDGKLLAAVRDGETVVLWETTTGRRVRQLKGCSVAFAPDGKLLACGDWRRQGGRMLQGGPVPDDGIIRLYDPATGAVVRQLPDCHDPTLAVAFSPDGRALASCGLSWRNAGSSEPEWPNLQAICLSDVASGRRRFAFGGPGGIRNLAFSPDGKTLSAIAPGQDSTIYLWETATGNERGRLPADPPIFAVAWAPDGTVLAGGYDDGSVRLWDCSPEREIGANARAAGRVHTGSPLWNWPAGREIGRLAGHRGRVSALAFTPDGSRLFSGSSDTTVLMWDVTGLLGRPPRPAVTADAAQVAVAWKDLAGADAAAAFRATRLLAAVPERSLPLLREHLRAAPVADGKQINLWLSDLDSPEFAARERATRALERLGERAVPALERFLAGNASAEARRRAEPLVARLDGPVRDPERLREVRALEVLEVVGSAEARQVLTTLAGGDPAARLTADARAALARLARRR
jgi:WD40 repeat protein